MQRGHLRKLAILAVANMAKQELKQETTVRQFKLWLGVALLTTLLVGCGSSHPDSSGPATTNPSASGNAFLYVSNTAENTISGFRIDNTFGTLTAVTGSPFVASGKLPGRAVVDRSGQLLLVINQAPASVSSYRIDRTTGLLTSGTTANTAAGPIALATHPAKTFVYVLNSAGTINGFSFDSNGLFVPLPRSPYLLSAGAVNPQQLAIDSAGQFMFVTSQGGIDILQIGSDGSLVLLTLPHVAVGALPTGIAVDPAANFLYSLDFGVSTGSTGRIFGWTPSIGIGGNTGLTPLPLTPLPVGINPVWISIVPTGKFAYVGGGAPGASTIHGFSIASDGTLTPVPGSPFAVPPTIVQMVIDPSGSFLYTASPGVAVLGLPQPGTGNVNAFSIDSSGLLIKVQGSPFTMASPGGVAIVRFPPQ